MSFLSQKNKGDDPKKLSPSSMFEAYEHLTDDDSWYLTTQPNQLIVPAKTAREIVASQVFNNAFTDDDNTSPLDKIINKQIERINNGDGK